MLQRSGLRGASQFHLILSVLTLPRANAMSTIIVGEFFTAVGNLDKNHAKGALVRGALALREAFLLGIIAHILGQAVRFSFISFSLNLC